MTQKRDRRTRPGLGVWRHPQVLTHQVATIVARRDKGTPEMVTEVSLTLIALAERVLPTSRFTAARRTHLQRLAVTAKRSQITRTLLSWRFELPDRTVRTLTSKRTLARSLDGILYLRWA